MFTLLKPLPGWLLALLVLFFSSQESHATRSFHLICPTWVHSTGAVGQIFYPSASCVLNAGMKGSTQTGYTCTGKHISGIGRAGTNAACTVSWTDNVATMGNGHYYQNCPTCPRLASDGVTADTGTMSRYFLDGTASGGCAGSAFPVASSWVCNVTALAECTESGGSRHACSFSHYREPDLITVVTELLNLQNFFVMGVIALIALGGFLFGWRLGHGSTTQ